MSNDGKRRFHIIEEIESSPADATSHCLRIVIKSRQENGKLTFHDVMRFHVQTP